MEVNGWKKGRRTETVPHIQPEAHCMSWKKEGISLLLSLPLVAGAERYRKHSCAAAEPSDLERDKAQRCVNVCLVIAIARKKTTQSLAASPYLPRVLLYSLSWTWQKDPEEAVVVSVGLQSKLYANPTTGTIETFISLSNRCILWLIPAMGGDIDF